MSCPQCGSQTTRRGLCAPCARRERAEEQLEKRDAPELELLDAECPECGVERALREDRPCAGCRADSDREKIVTDGGAETGSADSRIRCDTCQFKAPRDEMRKLNTTGGRFAAVCRSCREQLRSHFRDGDPDYRRFDTDGDDPVDEDDDLVTDGGVPTDEWRVVDESTGEVIATRPDPAEAAEIRSRRNSERPPDERTLVVRRPLDEVPHEN